MMIPTGFYGDCSHYADMPKPEEIFDWEKYTNPNYLLADDNKEDNNSKDEANNPNYSFIL